MSKPSRRANREVIKQKRKEKKKAAKQLLQTQRAKGLAPAVVPSISNAKSSYQSEQEEKHARLTAVSEQHRILQANLPVLLRRFSRITDPRNAKKIKYKLTLVMIYGILTFVYQMASRREANRKMTLPMFVKNLKMLFPEIEELPHNDTLMRLLERIDVSEIEKAQLELVRSLIRKKKFIRYLINAHYPVAIDGTQKFVRSYLWSEECLEREVKKGDGNQKQYYVYVLEASLAFYNGMTIPLMSEFLSYAQGDSDADKQDCERNAFKRLAKRLKAEFKRLPIMVLLDGLYPNGPVLEICRSHNWDFMIVLQDKSLSSVWEEYEGLKKLLPQNSYQRAYKGRKQHFRWVNDIEYYYDGFKKQIVHVVVCEESWQEVDQDSGQIETKSSRHAWISSEPLEPKNIHERCNLGARHRWNIETELLAQKRQGYQYEHCFSYDWNAMRGYHYLMRIGRTINVLAQYSECLVPMFIEKGVRGFIDFVRETLTGPWLDIDWLQARLKRPYQLRLI
jgi:hypothetical protein